MRIFNQDKTEELQSVDYEKGYLDIGTLINHIPEQTEIKEQFHYEVIREYSNGGKDVKKVVEVEGRPYIPAHDEEETINIYIPYTQAQLDEIKIAKLKQNLEDTDYQAIKYAEGLISEKDYATIKAQRQAWRDEINRLGG